MPSERFAFRVQFPPRPGSAARSPSILKRLIFSGEGETGLFKAEAFFARDGRLIKLCVVGEEGTTIDAEICVSAVTLAVSMGKMKMRPMSTREPPQNRRSLPKRAAQTDAILVQRIRHCAMDEQLSR